MKRITIKLEPEQLKEIMYIKDNPWPTHKRVGKTGGRLGRYLISKFKI
jgi:hypothetical protein